MKLKKSILAGLMCLLPFAPCKAQKAVHFATRTGLVGKINKVSYLGGVDVLLSKNKNFTDIFTGVMVQPDKTATFALRGVNNYSWTKI